jgi:hypothetical protein
MSPSTPIDPSLSPAARGQGKRPPRRRALTQPMTTLHTTTTLIAAPGCWQWSAKLVAPDRRLRVAHGKARNYALAIKAVRRALARLTREYHASAR